MSGQIKDSNYINIQGWMVTKLGLKGTELMIYAIIHGMTQDGVSKYSGGLKYLTLWTSATKKSVITHLKSLCDKGYLIKHEKYVNNVKLCDYTVAVNEKNLPEETDEEEDNSLVTPVGKNLHRGREENTTEAAENLHRGRENFTTNNKYNNKIKNKKNNFEDTTYPCQIPDSDAPAPANSGADAQPQIKDRERVIRAWNRLEPLGIPPVSRVSSDSKRYKSLQARLRQYGVEGVLSAIENIKKSKFLQGGNRKGWTITFDWFVLPNNFPKVLEGNYADSPSGSEVNGYEGRSGRNDSGYRQAKTTAETGRTRFSDPEMQRRYEEARSRIVLEDDE
jgi:hypothetical protein